MNYVLDTPHENANTAIKARTDVDKILSDYGYKTLFFYSDESVSSMIKGITHALATVRKQTTKNDTVVIQYPCFVEAGHRFLFWYLNRLRKRNHIRVAIVIHDLDILRYDSKDNKKSLQNLISYFNKIDLIISHNEVMRQFLLDNGCTSNIVLNQPFLYLSEDKTMTPEYGNTIIIAGNLDRNKCGYIYGLNQIHGVTFNLYGPNYDSSFKANNIKYNGSFPPSELASHLEGSFGLVWDGTTCDTCDGKTGQYLRINNPHKLSMYISVGLPIIIWKEAALAKYVEANHIGIVVASLRDLSSTLNHITEEEYRLMHDNVLKVRYGLITGKHFLSLLS